MRDNNNETTKEGAHRIGLRNALLRCCGVDCGVFLLLLLLSVFMW